MSDPNNPASNPYAAPAVVEAQLVNGLQVPEKDKEKIAAIIKDANQFWLALILCLLCSIVGAMIVPIWYFSRFQQWNKMSSKYPALNNPDASPKSVTARFQAAHWKLITGMSVGLLLWLIHGTALLTMFFG